MFNKKLKRLKLKEKLQNHMMVSGRKLLCEKMLLQSLKVLQKNTKKNHKILLMTSLINSTPVISMKTAEKKKGKTMKEFPYILNNKNRITVSIKSILQSVNNKRKFVLELSKEILVNSQNSSAVSKVKESKQNEALIKKKFAFFRWFC